MSNSDFEKDQSRKLIDYYAALGVSKTATVQEIQSAFRKLALRYHPDKNNDDPAIVEKFAKLTSYRNVLENDTRRKKYDLALTNQSRVPSINRYESRAEHRNSLGTPDRNDFTGSPGNPQSKSSYSYTVKHKYPLAYDDARGCRQVDRAHIHTAVADKNKNQSKYNHQSGQRDSDSVDDGGTRSRPKKDNQDHKSGKTPSDTDTLLRNCEAGFRGLHLESQACKPQNRTHRHDDHHERRKKYDDIHDDEKRTRERHPLNSRMNRPADDANSLPAFGGYRRPWPELKQGKMPDVRYRETHYDELFRDILERCKRMCEIATKSSNLLKGFEKLTMKEIDALHNKKSDRLERRAVGMVAVVTDLLYHILDFSARVHYKQIRHDIHKACDHPHLLQKIYRLAHNLSDAWLVTEQELDLVKQGVDDEGWTIKAVVASLKTVIEKWEEKIQLPDTIRKDIHNVLRSSEFTYKMWGSNDEHYFGPIE